MLFFFEHHGMGGTDLFRANRLRDQSFPAHLHRAYELIYVNSGRLTLQVEQKRYQMEAGDLAFVFCNQIHSFAAPDHADISVILFSPELIGDFYSAHKGMVPVNNVIHPPGPHQFHHLGSVYAQKSILYRVCGELLAETGWEPAGSRSQVAVLQQVFAYVDQHFGESCLLADVAVALQYDYAYLSRLFARLAGVRFTAYLNHYRIAQACYLLRGGGRTVSDIAVQCGYGTLRTFHRNFRLVMRCSPRDYLAGKGGPGMGG